MVKQLKKRGRKPFYPWAKWLSGGDFSITRGKQFHCSIIGMVQMIRSRVSENKLSASILVRGDVIQFRIFD